MTVQSDEESGLSNDEALRRLIDHGRNVLPPPRSDPVWRKVAVAAREPMSVLLIAAAAVSWLLAGETVDAVAILLVVGINIVIGIVQEHRADRALEELESMQAPVSRVLRDNVMVELDTVEIVPGDVVLVAAGDGIPADGRVTRATELEIDESLLTGESLPVSKQDGDQAYSGTLVGRGTGRIEVVATGSTTRLGQIALGLDRPPTTTPLQLQLDKLSFRLGVVAVVIAVGVFFVLWATTGGWQAAFVTAVALAVAAVPEGLPTAVVLALALGVRRMARHGAIVRRLSAVETLGSATVILTDKTGTLTHNRVRADALIDGLAAVHTIETLAPALADAAAEIAVACNDAGLDPPIGDAIDIGLLEGFGQAVAGVRSGHRRLAELPFDSRRRRQVVVTEQRQGRISLMAKGAPEVILVRCSHAVSEDGTTIPITEAMAENLLTLVEAEAAAGGRLIALARRSLGSVPDRIEAAEHDLQLVGIVRMRDPVRASAQLTIAAAEKAGIKVVMVTGDHPGTASSVANEVGMAATEMRTGADLDADGLPEDPRLHSVYARVGPEHKLALVEALQDRNEVVAVTGDGVNDAPALKASDIGVAMGASGSTVAAQAADMVITDDDLGTVVEAIAEGRAIYDNIRKVVEYLVGGNLSELIVVVAALIVLPSLSTPLLPLQLLWINLLTDSFPALALGVDTAAPDLMQRPPRPRGENLLDTVRLRILFGRGAVMATGPLVIGMVVEATGGQPALIRTVMFTTLVVIHLGYALVVRLPLRRPGPLLVGALGLGLVLQATALTFAPLRLLLDLESPGAGLIAAIVVTAVFTLGLLWAMSTRRPTNRLISR